MFTYFIFIISKSLGDILEGKLVNMQECPLIFTGPVGPVEVFFTDPKAKTDLGDFRLAWD